MKPGSGTTGRKQRTDPVLSSTGVPLPRYEAQELFSGAREIGIYHAETLYRLKITRLGKLILTK